MIFDIIKNYYIAYSSMFLFDSNIWIQKFCAMVSFLVSTPLNSDICSLRFCFTSGLAQKYLPICYNFSFHLKYLSIRNQPIVPPLLFFTLTNLGKMNCSFLSIHPFLLNVMVLIWIYIIKNKTKWQIMTLYIYNLNQNKLIFWFDNHISSINKLQRIS